MPSHLRPLAGLAAIVAVGALVLTGCASAAGADTPAASAAPGDAAAFPVTFDHVYGETTIEAAPERIATWGWGATDAVLALGIVPVAVSSMDYGGGEDRITPWVEDAIEKLGGEKPAILDNATYELSVEELLAADPDVLIAPYSGLTQEEYDAVTKAGIPVVAPEEALWSTPWRDVITETGKALGLEPEAQEMFGEVYGYAVPAIDPTGRTSVPGVWVAGNVTDLRAQVISAAAGGLNAAAMINMDLIEEETAAAVATYKRKSA